MEQDEYTEVIASVLPMEARMVAEMRVRGKMTLPDLQDVTGRKHGMTRELRKLQRLGLIRSVGRVPPRPGLKGVRPMRYEAVPMEQVEQARLAYVQQRPKKKVPKTRRARIEELRWREGEFEKWYRWRQRLLQFCQLVRQGEEMAFWEHTPDDDLAMVAEELGEVRQACDDMLLLLRLRADDLDARATIDTLLNESGRTGPEIESAKRIADRLRKRLRKSA